VASGAAVAPPLLPPTLDGAWLESRTYSPSSSSSKLARSVASGGSAAGSGGSQGETGVAAGPSSQTDTPATLALCVICCESPRGASIVHGRTACNVCCYNCARRLWKLKDRCPACRRTIQKIVYMRWG